MHIHTYQKQKCLTSSLFWLVLNDTQNNFTNNEKKNNFTNNEKKKLLEKKNCVTMVFFVCCWVNVDSNLLLQKIESHWMCGLVVKLGRWVRVQVSGRGVPAAARQLWIFKPPSSKRHHESWCTVAHTTRQIHQAALGRQFARLGAVRPSMSLSYETREKASK